MKIRPNFPQIFNHEFHKSHEYILNLKACVGAKKRGGVKFPMHHNVFVLGYLTQPRRI